MLIDPSVPFDYEHGGCRITCLVTGEEWQQNTYIVTHLATANTIIIDPGDRAEFIIEYIEYSNGRLTHILLTHPHHDHVGAVPQLSEYYDVACELHSLDIRLLMQAPMYALSFAKKKIASITRFQAFEDLRLNEAPRLCSLHTPGHTKGSTCFLFDGFVFTGDTLLRQHVGRTDLPGSSLPALNTSITTLLSKLPDDTVIFPGHGKPWEASAAKKWWNEVAICPPQNDRFIHA